MNKLIKPIKEQKYFKKEFSHKCNAHFLTRKNDLDQVVYSLIRTKNQFEAKELFLRIQENETSFGKVAKEYSRGHEKNTLGIIGPVPISAAHPKLVEILRSRKPGELVEPFMLDEWWIILRVESLQEASLDDAMEFKMNMELCQIWLKDRAESIIDDLKTKF